MVILWRHIDILFKQRHNPVPIASNACVILDCSVSHMVDLALNIEQNLVSAGRGKWSKPGVPHRGWQCVDIEDLGEQRVACDMCETQLIRFVHNMEHRNFPEVLGVGCVCAGHMEEDLSAARTREATMKSRAGKRKRWLTRKWRISAKGNPWLRSDGYRITVYSRQGGWAVTISKDDDSSVHHSRKVCNTQDQAKFAAFDHITKLLAPTYT